jgi:tRNA nucleotidyltransferase (CCA-adding enzyme)
VYKLVKHEEFGTARLFLKSGMHVDVAGSRLEEYDHPGAMPHVEQSSLRDDLFRRDFTINAMALCLNREAYGQLIDYYGGSRDLQQREIRFLHNMSFIDDATRIMRAVRFAGRYGFRLDKMTREAVGVALQAGALAQVSQERFTEEWIDIYQERQYQVMLEKLREAQVLSCWFGAELPWYTAADTEKAAKWTLARKWLVSLKHMSHEQITHALSRLKLNKSLVKSTTDYLSLREKMAAVQNWDNVMEIDDIMVNVPYFLRDIAAEQEEYRQSMAKYEAVRVQCKSRVNGLDIVSLGVKEGPLVGLLLRQLRQLWLEGAVTTPEEETAKLKELIDAN